MGTLLLHEGDSLSDLCGDEDFRDADDLLCYETLCPSDLGVDFRDLEVDYCSQNEQQEEHSPDPLLKKYMRLVDAGGSEEWMMRYVAEGTEKYAFDLNFLRAEEATVAMTAEYAAMRLVAAESAEVASAFFEEKSHFEEWETPLRKWACRPQQGEDACQLCESTALRLVMCEIEEDQTELDLVILLAAWDVCVWATEVACATCVAKVGMEVASSVVQPFPFLKNVEETEGEQCNGGCEICQSKMVWRIPKRLPSAESVEAVLVRHVMQQLQRNERHLVVGGGCLEELKRALAASLEGVCEERAQIACTEGAAVAVDQTDEAGDM